MQSLVDFLMQRISEDEVAATAAGKLQFWRYDNEPLGWSLENDGGERILTVDPRTIAVGNYWNHAARHLPARVLAECAAKRRIVELHKFGPGYRQRQPWEPEWPQPEYVRDVCGECYEWDEDDDCASNAAAPCATIRTMAQVYNEHPDYRQDWA